MPKVYNPKSTKDIPARAFETYYGNLPGSLESRADKVRNAVRASYGDSDNNVYTCVVGTYTDSVVFTVSDDDANDDRTMAADYSIDEMGKVILSDAKEVRVGVVISVPTNATEADTKELGEAVEVVVAKIGRRPINRKKNRFYTKK